MVAVVAAWFFSFRPQAFGGPAEYVTVGGISMTPTMQNGDLAVVERQASYRLGEIIVFHVPAGQTDGGKTVIHRIVGGTGTIGFATKGDHNAGVDPWHPKTADVVGKVWFSVPGAVGWVIAAGVALGVLVLLLLMILRPVRRGAAPGGRRPGSGRRRSPRRKDGGTPP